MALALALVTSVVCLWSMEPAERFLNSEGEEVDPFSRTNVSATVLVFVRTDCPISNRYLPHLNTLREKFGEKRLAWWLVYPDHEATPAVIRDHLREFNSTWPGLCDPDHRLVEMAQAKVTPEAAVFDSSRRLLYHGRIDDRFIDFGRVRPSAVVRDLEELLTRLKSGQQVSASVTKAVGCAIEPVQK